MTTKLTHTEVDDCIRKLLDLYTEYYDWQAPTDKPSDEQYLKSINDVFLVKTDTKRPAYLARPYHKAKLPSGVTAVAYTVVPFFSEYLKQQINKQELHRAIYYADARPF